MNPIFDSELQAAVEQSGVVAVLMVDRAADAVPLAQALLDGGVTVMELTLRTPAALDALRLIRREVPAMVAGIGTILTPKQVDQAVDAGAAFGVSPGVNPAVVQAAVNKGLSFAPGVMTPSDIEQALALGCRLLKLFPAGLVGGLDYLKAVAAPYAHLGVKYIPLGGVNAANMEAYLASPLVGAIGGSWIADRKLIQAQDWAAITANATEATSLARRVRPVG
jgi:2-dehydro-3-deoxyphosphogluconate aldolase/(4S)-4-hydroxy-2-oxoglutarate aldolase